MSKVIPITSVLAAVLAAAPGAFAQVTYGRDSVVNPWPDAGRVPGSETRTAAAFADTTYIRQAIRGNALEVVLGRMAESRSDNDAVEEFAERMASDHGSMNKQWIELAEKNDMKIGGAWSGVDVGPAGQQSIERLDDLEGTEFDQAYTTEMIRQHERDEAAFQRMAASARSSEVRELANNGVPIIRQHLTLARQLGSRVGVSTTAGRAGGITTPRTAPSDHDRARRTGDRDAGIARDDRNVRGTLRGEDRAFIQNVLQDHLMHIRLAERARREAKSDETRRLAERMEDNFEKWQERWKDLADRYDVKEPSHLGRLHGQKVDRLERASRGNVDRTYATIVTEHLESVVPYFQKEGQAVQPAAVRRLVDEELPVIRELLARARRVQGQASDR